MPRARTHSLRSKLTGRERPCSIQSTFQLGVDSMQASQSQQSGNHKQEGWNSPRDLRQLKPGRQSLQTKWFPKHICTSEKAQPEAVKTNWRVSMGSTGNCPSWHQLHNSVCSTRIIGQALGWTLLWPRILPRESGTQWLAGEDKRANSGPGLCCYPGRLSRYVCHRCYEYCRTYQKRICQLQHFIVFNNC